MKKYHVATGDGKGYYAVGYETYREAKVVLDKAHIVEEECRFTNADRIRSMSDEELAAFFAERDMILLRKALSVFEAESLIPENAQDELVKDMLAALQQPAKEG